MGKSFREFMLEGYHVKRYYVHIDNLGDVGTYFRKSDATKVVKMSAKRLFGADEKERQKFYNEITSGKSEIYYLAPGHTPAGNLKRFLTAKNLTIMAKDDDNTPILKMNEEDKKNARRPNHFPQWGER